MPRPLIFLVDDDAAVAESLSVLLQSEDYEVRVCSSAEEFLTDDRRHVAAGVVLDIKLEGISGLDLLRQLNEESFAVPVVMISGHADDDSRQRAMDLGAAGFLSKPFSGDQLITVLQQLSRP